jgi:hypothetical protein
METGYSQKSAKYIRVSKHVYQMSPKAPRPLQKRKARQEDETPASSSESKSNKSLPRALGQPKDGSSSVKKKESTDKEKPVVDARYQVHEKMSSFFRTQQPE